MNSAQAIAQMMPTFAQGTQQLQNALIGPAMLLLIVGMVIRIITARSFENMGMTLVRLVIVSLVIVNIATVTNQVQQIAQDVTQATGFNQQQNMEQDYQTAMTTKFQMPGTQNQQPWQWLTNPMEMSGLAVFGVIVYFLSIAACCIMFVVTALQQILIYLEIAFSPIFMACLMINTLTPLATRYSTFFVSLCLWPLGFRVADLLLKFVIDMAVNSSNNAAVAATNALGGSMIWWVMALILGIFGYPCAAWLVSKSLVTGGSHGLGLVGASTLGVAAMTALNLMFQSVSSALFSPVRSGGGGSSQGASAQPPPLPNTYQNYAVRP